MHLDSLMLCVPVVLFSFFFFFKFLLLNSVMLCGYTTGGLSIHQLVDIWEFLVLGDYCNDTFFFIVIKYP